jgi:SWI/SNF-related matrix-associated actin-dependent regulator 1 of chromatin subfamily A
MAIDDCLMSSPAKSPSDENTNSNNSAAAPVIDCSSSSSSNNSSASDGEDSSRINGGRGGAKTTTQPLAQQQLSSNSNGTPLPLNAMSQQARSLVERHVLALSQLKLMFPAVDSPLLSKLLMDNDNNINRVVELLLLAAAPSATVANHLKRTSTTTANQGKKRLQKSRLPSQAPIAAPPPKKRRRRRGDDTEDSEASFSSDNDGDLSDDDDGSASDADYADSDEEGLQQETIEFFNTADTHQLRDMTNCTPEQVEIIQSLRPFADYADAQQRLKAQAGISAKILENYRDLKHGFASLDSLLTSCESISSDLAARIKSWASVKQFSSTTTKVAVVAAESDGTKDDVGGETAPAWEADETEMNFTEFAEKEAVVAANDQEDLEIIRTQPTSLSIQLKNYQLLGVNWLWLLHRKRLSGILADEMGLGKTAQVIAFIALLAERDNYHGPYLIVVPSSTSGMSYLMLFSTHIFNNGAENWLREFEKFCPSIAVRAYYGNQQERGWLRDQLKSERESIDVIVTTYNIAAGAKEDRKFLRKWGFQYLILDEGHMVKNVQSQRYKNLTTIKTPHRLLLTGTPVR